MRHTFKLLVLLLSALLIGCISTVKYSQKHAGVDKSFMGDFPGPLHNFDDLKDDVLLMAGSDIVNGGNSSVELYYTNHAGNNKAAGIRYELGGKYIYRYANIEGRIAPAVNAAKFDSFTFRMRGSGHVVRVKLKSKNIKGWDWHGFTISKTRSDWKTYYIPLKYFAQDGWGEIEDLDFSQIDLLQFQANSSIPGEKGWFEIDDLGFAMEPDSDSDFDGLIEDFETKKELLTMTVGDDAGNGGQSKAEGYQTDHGSGKAYGVKYELKQGYEYPYVALKLELEDAVDTRAFPGLSFKVRGSGNALKIQLWTENIGGYDLHSFRFNTTDEWVTYNVPPTEFRQQGFGKAQTLDMKRFKYINFQTDSQKAGEKGFFEVDDIRFGGELDEQYRFVEYPVVSEDKVDDGCYIGVFGPNYAENPTLVNDLERKIGKKFAQVMWYIDWAYDFPLEKCRNLWEKGYNSHIVWEMKEFEGEEQLPYKDLLGGKADRYLKKFAADVKTFGKPVYLRWGHEFNGDWYPWSIPQNDFDTQGYIDVYRYIVDLFRAEGATNTKWLWCPMNKSFPKDKRNNFIKAYPGDDYVDWIAIDGYNFGIVAPFQSKWEDFNEVFAAVYTECVKNFPAKPIMLGEFASGTVGGDKKKWISEGFKSLKENFTSIKMMVWFNINKETDWRIDGEAAVAKTFAAAMKDDYFISSRDASCTPPVINAEKALAGLEAIKKLNPYWQKHPATVPALSGNAVSLQKMVGWEGKYLFKIKQTDDALMGGSSWQSSDDIHGEVGMLYDEKNLYFGIKITDNVPYKNSAIDGNLWQGDCVEVVISTDPKADLNRRAFKEDDFQIFFAPGDKGRIKPHIYCPTLGKRIDSIIIIEDWAKGIFVHTVIPWKDLGDYRPTPGDKVGFTMALDDADESGQRDAQAMWFGSQSGFYNDPSVWNQIEFK